MAKTVRPNTLILHSRQDDVIPFADSEELVAKSDLPASALIEVGDDHRLADSEPLQTMLDACKEVMRRGWYNVSMNEPEPEFIDPKKLHPGPIRHESLSDELLGQVRSIYEIIGPYLDTTLEQFEINFMRDMHPESEVLLWSSITAAWIDYHKQHLNDELLPDEDEKKLIAALVVISMGVDDAEKLGVPVDVGRKLIACYDALGEELE